ncbi:hypothetical protein F2Q70_00004568 [Brassica cretica]|uniref:Uncharacterized protein n=1 Tax=Brassica cretica TaxID=69181 RepID=A0A8S9J188_BRACR|nr:hypothetical protein F2Q70_00004568 [Brassica cretica]
MNFRGNSEDYQFVGKVLGIYRGRTSSGYFDGLSNGPILGSSDKMFLGIFIGNFRGTEPSENSEEGVPRVDFRIYTVRFGEDHFRFHSYEDFETNCNLKGDLYDVVGHIKLVNGQILTEHLILDEVEIATTRRLLVHVQSHDEPVVKLYLWDQAGTEFCKKFKSYEKTPTVLLVTTANTKHLGDYDIQPTIDYFSWLGSNPEIAKQVNAEVVTKPETLTIGKYSPTSSRNLQSYAFPAIGFSFFHNGYRAKISVYDNSDQAVFVLLGDAGRELTGKYKSKLVSSYFQANQNQGVNHEVLVPAVGIHTVYNDL